MMLHVDRYIIHLKKASKDSYLARVYPAEGGVAIGAASDATPEGAVEKVLKERALIDKLWYKGTPGE